MKIKCLIIDDDPFILDLLSDKIELYLPEVAILDTAASGLEGIEKIKSHQPDLIFLDVELSDMTGFELLNQLNQSKFSTIFITSHNHYALKALRMDALDYLVKPIDKQELLAAVDKYKSKANNQVRAQTIKNSLSNLEAMIHNILPKEIAAEVKKNGLAKTTKHFDKVSILFTDIEKFTQHAERLPPEELVAELDYCYSAFDHIMEDHGIEKIKTIGDAYMAAGGLPTPTITNPHDTVKAALAIQDFLFQYKTERVAQGRLPFEMRIGIHTGPVVAGIVGIKKFAYDIWGDSVNIAAQMENRGVIGKVNISQDTFELIQDREEFSFTARGKIEVKGKGVLDMYFVEAKVDLGES